MADARTRAKDRRAAQRKFHLDRIREAQVSGGRAEALAAAWALFLSDFRNCTSDTVADRIGAEVFQFLITKSEELPRRQA